MKKFTIANYQIPLNRQKYQPFQKIRLLIISDLHNRSYGKDNCQLISKIRSISPDIILAAGDMLSSDTANEEHIALALMQCLAKEYPVYYGNGNHEYRMKLDTGKFGVRYAVYAKELRRAGVHLLENEYADVHINGIPLRIHGLELPWRYYRRLNRPELLSGELRKYLGRSRNDRYQIMIAHNPNYFKAYARWGADLTVSGHLHGGFFRLPFLGGVISPQLQLFPKYARGKFQEGGHYMVVSTGIGSHSLIPRFGNLPELVVVDLV